MKVEILSLSVTFVYDYENYRGILNSLSKLEALMFWKIAVFESQLLRRKISLKMIPLKRLVQVAVAPGLDTSSKTTPSTGRGDQFFQLISLLPGNTYQLKELAATSCCRRCHP